MKYLFIDIRKSDEVYSKRFDVSEDFSVYHIPMEMIRFNKDSIIKHIEYIDEIYIVCQSAARSQFVKDKYFSKFPQIKINPSLQFGALKHGENTVKMSEEEVLNVNVIGSNSFNLYNIMRIVQLVLGSMIVILGGFTLKQIGKNKSINKIPLILLILIGIMAIINGLTSTCSLSIILKDYLN